MNFLTKNLLPLVVFFSLSNVSIKTTKTTQIHLTYEKEFSFCDDNQDGLMNINLQLIKNQVLTDNISVFNFQTGLYIGTAFGEVIKVNNVLNQPQTQVLCSGTGGSFDIAINKNSEIFICSDASIRNINPLNCNTISFINLSQFFDTILTNSLSFDNLDNLYFSGVGYGSRVYKFSNNNFTSPILWHNFGQGRAGGDFVMNNGKMYVSWVVNNVDYLYEVTVNNLNEYISHVNLGILPQGTFGLASELGSLYGVTEDKLFKINLFGNGFTTNDILQNDSIEDKWYGLTGHNESRNFFTNAYISFEDAQNDTNPLPNEWQNTIPGGQTIYVSIEDEDSNERYIFPVKIIVNTPPIFNKVEQFYNCQNSLNPYLFDLDSIANVIRIGENDDVFFYPSFDDMINQNPVAGLYEISFVNKTMFVVIKNSITQCTSMYPIQLIVQPTAVCSQINDFKVCVDNLNIFSLDFTKEFLKNEFGFQHQNYEVEIFNSLHNANNNIDPLGNMITINQSNYPQLKTLYFSLTDLTSGCVTICEKTISLQEYFLEPKVYDLIINDFSSNNSIVVLSEDFSGLLFSLNGNDYTSNNTFENLLPGIYNIFIKNSINCTYSTQSIYLLDYPRFFTPNSDGINDFWKINFSYLEDKLITEIYNRYGKLLKVLSKNDGWDGKYQNNDLPSDDYWFKVIRSNGVIFQGHFTLKR